MKIAIVTGASSGLGKEFVKQIPHLYKELDEIWVVARREDILNDIKENSDCCIRVFAGDLQQNLVYYQILNRLENQSPDIRMLVNAAGYGKIGTVEELAKNDPAGQLNMIDVNCKALTRLTCLCLPYMSEGSRILNIASAAAFCPQSKFAVYAATKSYVLSFSRALNEELKDRRIFVTAVCPGPVDTSFFDVAGPARFTSKKALMSQPEDVVKQALVDSRARRPVSVYGSVMKCAEATSKLFPHDLVIKALDKMNIIQE